MKNGFEKKPDFNPRRLSMEALNQLLNRKRISSLKGVHLDEIANLLSTFTNLFFTLQKMFCVKQSSKMFRNSTF